MGVDIAVYRASIGSFYARIHLIYSCKSHVNNKSFNLRSLFLSIVLSNPSVACYIYFCLILAGDVHLNPGPPGPCEFSFCCINSRSLLSHEDKLSALQILSSENYSCIALTETWLSDAIDDQSICLDGYAVYRKDRDSRAGGVALFVKENLNIYGIETFDCTFTETLWVKFLTKRGSLYFGVCYCPQSVSEDAHNSDLFIDYLHGVFDHISESNALGFVCVGDFNAKDVRWGFTARNNALGHRLYDFVKDRGFAQMIHEPTRVTPISESLLDLIITDIPGLFSDSGTLPRLHVSCDHCIIYGCLTLHTSSVHNYFRSYWDTRRTDWDALNQALLRAPWDNFYEATEEPQEVFRRWLNLFVEITQMYIPLKRTRVKARDKPWITQYIRHCMNVRRRLYRKAKLINDRYSWERFHNADTEYFKAIHVAKNEYFSNLYDLLDNPRTCRKQWWKLAKSVYKNSSSSSIPDLKSNGDIFSNNDEKCEILNRFFTDQCTVNDTNAELPILDPLGPVLIAPVITQDIVSKVFSNLNSSKATGPDGISNELLKNISPGISKALARLFNFSLEVGVFPDNWKVANVIPIYKKGDRANASSYRPVSLLCCISKIFERVVADNLMAYLRSNDLLSENQAGFMPGDSTINQLIIITDKILEAFEKGKEVHTIFLDISKAFDRVWHKGLLLKLRHFGVTGSLLKWFNSYLSNRKQRVVLEGSSSSPTNVNAGVPQGSVLGPLLFLIYINDLTEVVSCDLFLFADDSTLLNEFDSKADSIDMLNRDLDAIQSWSLVWLVDFNPVKTEAMTFSCKRIQSGASGLFFCGREISVVTRHKHLGINLNFRMDWEEHVDYVTLKCMKRINVLRKLKHTIPRSSLNTLYFTMVRSVMDYGLVIYGGQQAQLMNRLENIQYQAGLIVSGALRYTSYDKLCSELCWPKISDRVWFLKSSLFYKTLNGLASPLFSRHVLNKCTRRGTPGSLRERSNLAPPFCRTTRYIMSFIPSTCRYWLSLNTDIKNTVSLASFKATYKKMYFKFPCPSRNIGSRKLNIILTRFRVGFTTLNLDLHHRGLSDSPLCACQLDVESYAHFFLHCPAHGRARGKLLGAIATLFNEIGINFFRLQAEAKLHHLIYGFQREFSPKNYLLFPLVLDFIKETGRFHIN